MQAKLECPIWFRGVGDRIVLTMPGQLSVCPAFSVCLLFKSSTKLIRQLVLSQFVSLSLLFMCFLHNVDVIVDIAWCRYRSRVAIWFIFLKEMRLSQYRDARLCHFLTQRTYLFQRQIPSPLPSTGYFATIALAPTGNLLTISCFHTSSIQNSVFSFIFSPVKIFV